VPNESARNEAPPWEIGVKPSADVCAGNLKSNALESPRMPDSRNVVVYSRKGCHLCELVKESLVKLSRRGGFTWHEIDVESDAELRRQFNDEVPVVFIDGRKAFKYRMDEQEFLRKLVS
jgi:glutaredoxin